MNPSSVYVSATASFDEGSSTISGSTSSGSLVFVVEDVSDPWNGFFIRRLEESFPSDTSSALFGTSDMDDTAEEDEGDPWMIQIRLRQVKSKFYG